MIRHVVPLLLFLVVPVASASVYEVTTTADSGAGSYRAAILAANSGECVRPCTIRFAIPGPVPASGWFTISPQSPLPPLTWTDAVTIDGSAQSQLTGDTNPRGPEIELDGTHAGFSSGLRIERVVQVTVTGMAINRFAVHGISVSNSSHVAIGPNTFNPLVGQGNYIGVDPTGSRALPNGVAGIAVVTTIGLNVYGNIVSGNGDNGLYIGAIYDVDIRANYIGVGLSRQPIPNGANGIDISSNGAFISANVIANNPHFGVCIGGQRIRVDANSIYGNGLLNIGLGHDGVDPADPLDTDDGPNGRMNAPVLLSATANASLPGYYIGDLTYSGVIRTKPATRVVIQAWASPNRNALGLANAQLWVSNENVTTDANGEARFTFRRTFMTIYDVLTPGGWLTATATTDEGTSELSYPIPIEPQNLFAVTTAADSGPGSLRDVIAQVNQSACTISLPCWVTFRIPGEELTNGVAVIAPLTPLPAITRDYVHVDGSSQTWTVGDTNPAGPEVELRGWHLDAGSGLTIGTDAAKINESFITAIAVDGFPGNGIDIRAGDEGYDVRLRQVIVGLDATGAARGNRGDGVWMRGARRGALEPQWVMQECTIAGNGGNGVRMEATGSSITRSNIGIGLDRSPQPNGGSGVLVDHAVDVQITDDTIAHNRGAGVATTRNATAVYVDSLLVWNGRLGIDRNNDGVGGGAADGVMPAPAITSATWDAAKGVTVVEGDFGPGNPLLYIPGLAFSGVGRQLLFYVNAVPDPSGFGQGERPATYNGVYAPPNTTGDHFRAEIQHDLRGWYLTGTSSYTFCYYEFGCRGRDTSEFSNAVLVK